MTKLGYVPIADLLANHLANASTRSSLGRRRAQMPAFSSRMRSSSVRSTRSCRTHAWNQRSCSITAMSGLKAPHTAAARNLLQEHLEGPQDAVLLFCVPRLPLWLLEQVVAAAPGIEALCRTRPRTFLLRLASAQRFINLMSSGTRRTADAGPSEELNIYCLWGHEASSASRPSRASRTRRRWFSAVG